MGKCFWGGFLVGFGASLVYNGAKLVISGMTDIQNRDIWKKADEEYLKTTPGTRMEMFTDGTVEFTEPDGTSTRIE